ncbi:hypothetical protein NESM_000637200 [Novymonas esmeraldas]|uniref:Uncharacterized protein n=1 Tax=Novymonas esmeraldas TaxID=1808958 RepID=A0AAW0ERV7_9TRYP
MGTAPSAEMVRDAPFRAPQGGVRQVAIIPIVEQYFPTPDCALFRQLYEAYTDPSVRYYMRTDFEGSAGDLSRIPPIENTREEMHRLLLRHTAYGMFPSNAAVREAYEVGDFYRIRPVLCAVVFLYEGASYVPEGSVQMPSPSRSGPPAYVKVIGIIGDTRTLVRRADDPLIPFRPDDVLKIRTLIMKSAGDHNMSRVVLLAAYVYYYQCCSVIGLPNVPTLASCFTCFKTNIPFLCFLREMRDRTACVLTGPRGSKFYIDEYCLHGSVTREFVAKMMPAFACYYIAFLTAKSEQRLQKQQAHQQHLFANGAAKDRAGLAGCGVMHRTESHIGTVYTDTFNTPTMVAMRTAALESVMNDVGNVAPKITYIVKGYITRAATSLSTWSHAANEVYVACVDSTLTVVDRAAVEAEDGPTRTPALVHDADEADAAPKSPSTAAAAPVVVETLQVRRGDILSFYVPPTPTAAHVFTEGDDEDVHNRSGTLDLDALQFRATDTSSAASEHGEGKEGEEGEGPRRASADLAGAVSKGGSEDPNASTVTDSSAAAAAAHFIPQKGSWRVDDNIYVENVLLSLVRDECKLAREATEQDPGWVYDDDNKCLVHDGSFYVWHFRRGHEDFYYGTVPKFANPNRHASRSTNGGAGAEPGKTGGSVGGSGAGAAKDATTNQSGAHGGKGGAVPAHPPNTPAHSGKTPPLPPQALPPARQHLFAQAIPPHAGYLPPGFAGASGDMQQAYHSSLAATGLPPPPPAYSGPGVPQLTGPGAAAHGYPKNMPYAMMAPPEGTGAAPVMYTFLPPQHPGSAQVRMPEQQQLQLAPPQFQSYASPVMYSHGVPPPPSPPHQQQPQVWPMMTSAPNAHYSSAAPQSQSLVPYVMNAHGQLVPLGSMMGGVAGTAMPPPQPVSYPPPIAATAVATGGAEAYPRYVMMNGQLCVLQSTPSAYTAAPSTPPQMYQAYPQIMEFRQ